MGFILGCLCVALISCGITIYNTTEHERFANGIVGFFVPCLITLVVCIIVWCQSYSSYLDARTFYDSTREQYANSVEMYHDYALLDLKGAAAIAFTDYKYQDYQKNMADFIRVLRGSVIRYNKRIISKRIMKKTFFFSWLIVAPDPNMKIVKMTSKAIGALENDNDNR